MNTNSNTELRYICVPLGSAGDAQPLVWLGRVMAARGYDVVMVVQRAVEQFAQRSGLRYVAVGDLAAQEALVKDPALWHPRQAFQLIATAVPVAAREMLPALEHELTTAPDGAVILAGSLAFAARIAGAKHHTPVISVHLQPTVMMSVDDTPVMMAGMEWLPRAPRFLRRLIFHLGNWQVHRALGPPLRQLCRDAGLPNGHLPGAEKNIWHAPDGQLCLFPDWFAPKAADWPANAITTRFPLYDEAPVLTEDAALEAFLQTGDAKEKPLLFTPGSANAQAAAFFREAVATCLRMNRRGILATRYPEQLPKNLPGTIRAFEYIPFSRIFPRCAAIIHHGGVGTTAQCLAAGVPQLIMPLAHDQPDNAARIKRLGVGDYLYPKKFQAPRIAARLETLLASTDVQNACIQYRQKITQQISEPEMAAAIEQLVERAQKTATVQAR